MSPADSEGDLYPSTYLHMRIHENYVNCKSLFSSNVGFFCKGYFESKYNARCVYLCMIIYIFLPK